MKNQKEKDKNRFMIIRDHCLRKKRIIEKNQFIKMKFMVNIKMDLLKEIDLNELYVKIKIYVENMRKNYINL